VDADDPIEEELNELKSIFDTLVSRSGDIRMSSKTSVTRIVQKSFCRLIGNQQ